MRFDEINPLTRSLSSVSRRDFLKFCSAVAVSFGLPAGMGAKIAEAVESKKRPPVIWLSGQECTGCTESLLRTTHPALDKLILDLISLDYSETLSTAAGHLAEENRERSMRENSGEFILVIEGSIPTKDGGIYCKVAGRPFIDTVKETAEHAGAIVAIGSCAAWGGIPSSSPNPTGAKGAPEVLEGKTVISIPGCPPNPYNFLSTVLYYLTFSKLPKLDEKGRPTLGYGRLIHENCERRPHFNAGRFAKQFGDEGHQKGWCLYKLGCKGPETHANCPIILFGDVGSGAWPVGTGHPCFGCTEEDVAFTVPLHAPARLEYVTPPSTYPSIEGEKGEEGSTAAKVALGAVAGAAVGAGAAMTAKLAREEKSGGEGGQDSKGSEEEEKK